MDMTNQEYRAARMQERISNVKGFYSMLRNHEYSHSDAVHMVAEGVSSSTDEIRAYLLSNENTFNEDRVKSICDLYDAFRDLGNSNLKSIDNVVKELDADRDEVVAVISTYRGKR